MTQPQDIPTARFEQNRARLIGLAYRMLGELHEAQDVVQDAWLRWSGHEDEVRDPEVIIGLEEVNAGIGVVVRAREQVIVVMTPEFDPATGELVLLSSVLNPAKMAAMPAQPPAR